jgi:phosphate transport system substrate-binding protein
MLRSAKLRVVAMVATIAMAAAVTPAFAATTLHIDGSTTLQPLAQTWASVYKAKTGWAITVAGGGSGKGVSDAEAGVVDIGMSSAVKAPTAPADVVFTPVARDALIIVVNPRNAFYKITQAQVKQIFSGQITNWHQLSSSYPSHSIDLVGRTGSSGTYSYFKSSMMSGSKQSGRTRTLASNGMVRSAVAGDRYAIGYLAMAYKNSSVKALNMPRVSGATSDFVVPSKTTALNGSYPYVRDLYFVTKGAPAGNASTFIKWCLSSAGQTYTRTDYLPLH